jgi:hypothetical protein
MQTMISPAFAKIFALSLTSGSFSFAKAARYYITARTSIRENILKDITASFNSTG